MNIEQMKRNDLTQPDNIKYFVKALMNREFKYGPAMMSDALVEAFLSDDESFSAQVWFSIMGFMAKFNVEMDNEFVYGKAFAENDRVLGYTRLIKRVFETFKHEDVSLAFFNNYRKWARKIINELNSEWKAIIFSMDAYFWGVLKELGYKHATELLASEGIKVKAMAESYYSFMKPTRKEQK